MGGAPAAPVYNAMGRGVNLRIVADRSQVYPGRSIAPLVARKELEGRIQGPADLFGKRIAVSGEAATSWVDVHRWALEAGLDPAGLDIVTMGFPDMVPALAGGQVDIIAVVRHNKTLAMGNYRAAADVGNFFLRGFNYLFIMRKAAGASRS